MRIQRFAAILFIAGMIGFVFSPARAYAGVEVTGVFGGLLGSDLGDLADNDFSLSRSLDNAPLYGARVSFFLPFIGIEGSYVRSNTSVAYDGLSLPISADANISYLEANGIISPIPGPFSPFFTAGIGRHSFDFNVEIQNLGTIEATIDKTGYNFGAGLRMSFARLVVRGEVRDHVTKITPEDFGLGNLAEQLGFDESRTLHNIEVSMGVGVSF